MPGGVEQSAESSQTRMRIDSVPDTPPATITLLAAVPPSSATRIVPTPTMFSQPVALKTDTNEDPRSELAHDEAPTVSHEPAVPTVSESSYHRSHMSTESYAPLHRSHRSGGRFAFIAIGLGLVIGVGVWAGIGGEIAALFTGSSTEVPVDNPARVTETPASLRDRGTTAATLPSDPGDNAPVVIESPSASEWESSESTAMPAAPARNADLDRPHRASSATVVADRAAEDQKATTKNAMSSHEERVAPATVVESMPRVSNQGVAQERQVRGDETRGGPTVYSVAQETPREPAVERTASTSTPRYSVQVRATSDRREAEGIARRLREKGVAGVRVEKWKKNGVDMFRVRYGEFSSGDEAKGAAERLRHQNVWIVRQP